MIHSYSLGGFDTRSKTAASIVVLIVAFALVGVTAFAGAGSAQSTATPNSTINESAPYYDNSTGNVSSGGWVPGENATIDNIGKMSTRFLSTFIGFGSMDPSGTGYQGVLILAVVMGGVTIGAMLGTGIGPVGGTILGMTVGYGLVGLGLAPVWVKPILLFGIGITAAAAVRRMVR